ncbi:MAG TPA: FG-GAP-like repeat-containing protein [Terracidiphilus sp.]|jgi:Flp pilus assembly protein TadD/peroxiredoxin|nr:FG-GAP-like repeat-containing protein [Terracidiphilus sp.]
MYGGSAIGGAGVMGRGEAVRISRRGFVKVAGMAGAFWSSVAPRRLWAAATGDRQTPCLIQSGSGYAPFIEPFLNRIQPGNDEFIAEKYAFELEHLLDSWAAALQAGAHDLGIPKEWLEGTLEGAQLDRATVQILRAEPPIESERALFPAATTRSSEDFLAALGRYLAPLTQIESCDLQVDAIEIVSDAPLHVRTQVHYQITGRLDSSRREQRTGEWSIGWQQPSKGEWRIVHWSAAAELRSRLTGPGFADVTAAALGQVDSYRKQMLLGIDHWRTILDSACGIDIYGNNGVCTGDFDGDGLDDIYVCQSAGLPNRLYKNRGDGTFVDVTERAGVGVLDGTACALFADLTNSGRQDLIVVRNNGPLLFANRGDGAFELKPDAFPFARPAQGSFTSASIADYNRDGLLDIYFCTYSVTQGMSGNEYPTPYYDAQNGPPNFLMRNGGNYSFEDVTIPSGMDVSNNRYSFAAHWSDYDRDGWPDLYVVNDFGRKVLYRNNGNGTFTDVSSEAGIEDPGEGMDMTWFDYDNDGWEDMYIVNMWESAGARVTGQPQFMPTAPESVRRTVRRDALGNTLLHNEGASGKFRETTDESGTRFGGWNWGSEAWDFDHDGYQDIYVANGFISGENREDLSSFFWRQIAARSFDSGGRAQAYTDAWSAINEFIRCGYTWSGYQRNNFYLNNRNSTFTEAASVLGIDCLEDSRSFALSDLDGDGRLEIVLKNRTAPQLRIFQNRMSPLGSSILFSLRGTTSNRDAVGAVIELETASDKQIRTLRAGSGFLSQNTKAIHFGLGHNSGTPRATIQWPNGTRQVLENLPANHRIEVVEGVADFHAVPFKPPQWAQSTSEPSTLHQPAPASRGTWLLDPIQIPNPALTDADGTPRTLNEWKGRAQLLAFASPSCSKSAAFLVELERGQAEWKKSGIAVIAIVVNAGENGGSVSAQITYPLLFADEKASRVLDVFRRYIFDRRRDMPLPSAFLLDDKGNVVRVYDGGIDVAELAADCSRIPRSAEQRFKLGLPFPGRYLSGELHRDYFMYGVAYLQYEEYDEAQAAFEKSIQSSQTNPIAYYDLGLIALYKGQFAEARSRLEKAVELDPANADAWNNLGVATGQSGDQDQARRDFQRALDRQPGHPTAVQNMIKVLRYLNRPQEAREVLLKAIEADPRQAQLHSELGMILIDSGDIEDARAEFEKAVDLEPSNPEMINALGVVYMQIGNDERAMQILERCKRIAPDYGPAVLNMAVLYLSAGKADKAHDLLSDFLRAHPDNKDVRDALQEVDRKR